MWQDLDNLQKIYASVHDVDLIVGAISEMPKAKATVGVTLACIIGMYNVQHTRTHTPTICYIAQFIFVH